MTPTRTGTIPREQRDLDEAGARDGPFHVILYNDDVHPFDAVVRQVQKATGAPAGEAFVITLQAHEQGRAVCFAGSAEACQRVADVLREIALHVEVNRVS
jgi:ATP-dependent Clp protease adapter protein ClpS